MADVVVLIVEDEPLIRIEIEDAVEAGGYASIWAGNGEEAIAKLEAPEQNVRALVTDINFGGEMSGWDVARRGRELLPDMPVVYVSSVDRAEWSSQGVPNSILISKPFASAQIVTALSQLLNATESSGGNRLN